MAACGVKSGRLIQVNCEQAWKSRIGLEFWNFGNWRQTGRAGTTETNDLLTSSKSHLEDGASVPCLRQRGKQQEKGIHATWKRRTRKQKARR